MLTRCRVWVVYQGYYQELGRTCLRTFGQQPDGDVQWRFDVPVGRGKVMTLDVALRMLRGENAVQLTFARGANGGDEDALQVTESVRLVIRPDVEDRINHGKTKAFAGPEAHWPRAVEPAREGFLFRPDPGRALRVTVTEGQFHSEPEWIDRSRIFNSQVSGHDPTMPHLLSACKLHSQGLTPIAPLWPRGLSRR